MTMVAASQESTLRLAQDLTDMYMGAYDQYSSPGSETFKFKEIFEALYLDHPESRGKEASKRERADKNYESATLVYGEISFEPFGIFFEKIKNEYGGLKTSGGKFYDLGCGQGKPTFAAALLHDFDSCTGIEILEEVRNCAVEVLENWNRDIKWELPFEKQQTKIEFRLGDVLEEEWSDADIVFCNSTCFTEDIMDSLARKAEMLDEGAFFITTTKPLPSKMYRIMEVNKMMETWGVATIFIQKKIV